MISIRRAATACLLLGAVLAGAPATAQTDAPSALPGVFGEVLDVRVVNIEVVVTDRQGIPILGLGPGDFTLVVDGEAVPIDYFTEVRGGLAVEGAADEGRAAGVPALAPGEPVGTSYLLFIDEYFSLPNDRDRVLEALIEDLPLLAPEDRMAVVAFDGRDLEMLSSWSSVVPTLERVLKRARERPAKGLQRIAERRQYSIAEGLPVVEILGGDEFGGALVRTQLNPEERAYLQLVSEQLDRSVAAAAATLRSFAKPPGRKVMLLLSGGWPYLPTEFLLGGFSRIILDREGLEGEDLYGRLIDTANLLGYSLYPVDVPGLDREPTGIGIDSPTGLVASQRSMMREQELHYTLEHLARRTGGKAFVNAGRLEAFAGAVSDTRSYYWIGFTPERAWDDARHSIEVRTANPDFRVRTRSGYLDSSRSREVTMAVESALLFGNAAADASLAVSAGEARRAGRRRMEVPIRVRIPLDRLTFLPTGEGYSSQLEIRFAVRDDKGRRAEIPVVPVALNAAEAPGAGRETTFETTLRLRRDVHELVVAVYDPASGRILTGGLEIQP